MGSAVNTNTAQQFINQMGDLVIDTYKEKGIPAKELVLVDHYIVMVLDNGLKLTVGEGDDIYVWWIDTNIESPEFDEWEREE